ncbi:MAG: hypothetical protein Fur0018_02130 [Anaerolineales bacterium]
MNDFINIMLPFLRDGTQYGLAAGILAGGLTWSLINNADYLFRAAMGFLLGMVIGGLLVGADLAHAWGQILAAAGNPMPQRLVQDVIHLAVTILVSGLGGALFFMLVSAPRDTVLGILFGALAGLVLGIILAIVIQYTGLVLNPLFYPPLIGLLVLVLFSVFGGM